jgi:glucose/mannose-6-phosphate isomerase
MHKIELISEEKWGEVLESIDVVETHCGEMRPEVPLQLNSGKELAESIKGYIPFIYAPRLFSSVAYRYNTQFNENSKSPSSTNFYPEAFHNSIMEREGDKELLKKLCAIIIRDTKSNSGLNKKIDKHIDLMQETFGKILEVETRGHSNLARMMSALIQGDFTSAYLGILLGVDPSSTESIRIIKSDRI